MDPAGAASRAKVLAAVSLPCRAQSLCVPGSGCGCCARSVSSESSASSSESEDAGKGLTAKELAELKTMLKHLSLRRQDVRASTLLAVTVQCNLDLVEPYFECRHRCGM